MREGFYNNISHCTYGNMILVNVCFGHLQINIIIKSFINRNGNILQLRGELLELDSLDARVQASCRYLTSKNTDIPLTDDLLHCAESFYRKLLAADQYTVTTRLNAEQHVTLIKASEIQPESHKLGDDYGLSQVRMLIVNAKNDF